MALPLLVANMATSPLIRQVYREHLERFGEPDDAITYDNDEQSYGQPSRISVVVWHRSAEVDFTTFSTIGMAALPMRGAGHRAELHFTIRHDVDRAIVGAVSKFLANLAIHPFVNDTYFDWWHKLRHPDQIPLFREATAVLFHPRFANTGWDMIKFNSVLVKILNVVPITANEYGIDHVTDLIEHWRRTDVDVFAPR
jgi:Suppressor of fused protein (SUFU)